MERKLNGKQQMRQRRYRGIREVGHIHVKEEKQKDLEKIVIGVLKYLKEVRENELRN